MPPSPCKLLHLTDVHFGGEDVAAAEAAVAFANDYAPLLTVMTGDVTLNGLPKEFQAGAKWLGRLPHPLVVTPGNHDTPYWNIPLRALLPFGRYHRWIGPSSGVGFDSAALGVRMINTSRGAQPRPDWSKGAINLELCRSAAADLAKADPGALRVVGLHHPLVEAEGAPVTGGVHRGTLAAAILAEGGVDLILSGHVHNPFAVNLPACDGLTYAVGAGTLSVRLRGTPPSFNTVEWDDREIRICAQGWTGERFEPFRGWTVPRRARA
ncbi:metallophosphoesterase [soil metagenome]